MGQDTANMTFSRDIQFTPTGPACVGWFYVYHLGVQHCLEVSPPIDLEPGFAIKAAASSAMSDIDWAAMHPAPVRAWMLTLGTIEAWRAVAKMS